MLSRIYGPPRITLVLPRAEAKAWELSISVGRKPGNQDQNANLTGCFGSGVAWQHIAWNETPRWWKVILVACLMCRQTIWRCHSQARWEYKESIDDIYISWYFMNFRMKHAMKQEVSYVEWDGFTWWKRGLWSLKPWVKSVWRWFFGFFFFIGGWSRQR